MKRTVRELGAFICVVCIGFLASAAVVVDRGTEAQAKALVARAIAAYDARGQSAFSEMTAPSTAFTDRDLYIFVIGPIIRLLLMVSTPTASDRTSSLSGMQWAKTLARNLSTGRRRRVSGCSTS
jgi:hypothetical protein